jgi:hypothetical protein
MNRKDVVIPLFNYHSHIQYMTILDTIAITIRTTIPINTIVNHLSKLRISLNYQGRTYHFDSTFGFIL